MTDNNWCDGIFALLQERRQSGLWDIELYRVIGVIGKSYCAVRAVINDDDEIIVLGVKREVRHFDPTESVSNGVRLSFHYGEDAAIAAHDLAILEQDEREESLAISRRNRQDRGKIASAAQASNAH
ncbi:hypothetical protein EXN61_21970 [Agrobacterium tumefaciens]|uniref:Uncharacterized protein n=1 Tax=Agrobacterium tumefaciens TaxID=358 RepID=A0A546XS19_AGRTU|nr:hypothetical protein [Agrobacterium tumefaciens]TRB03526.1 hypothetical protein EXN61_21970 [Agrobacterium tumefaciens]